MRYEMTITPITTLCCYFFFNDTATTEIYTLSLHDALPIYAALGCQEPRARDRHRRPRGLRARARRAPGLGRQRLDRKSTRLNSSHGYISYAVFCLKKKKKQMSTCIYCNISECAVSVLNCTV